MNHQHYNWDVIGHTQGFWSLLGFKPRFLPCFEPPTVSRRNPPSLAYLRKFPRLAVQGCPKYPVSQGRGARGWYVKEFFFFVDSFTCDQFMYTQQGFCDQFYFFWGKLYYIMVRNWGEILTDIASHGFKIQGLLKVVQVMDHTPCRHAHVAGPGVRIFGGFGTWWSWKCVWEGDETAVPWGS